MNFVDWCIVEQWSCSWTEKGNHCIDLRTNFFSNELLFSSRPDGKDASNCEIINNNWTSIQWVESDIITFSLSVELFQFRSFLTSETFNEGVFLQVFFDNLVSMDILLKLSITKLVSWFKNDDGWMSKEQSYFCWSIKDSLNNWSFRTSEFCVWVVHFWIGL